MKGYRRVLPAKEAILPEYQAHPEMAADDPRTDTAMEVIDTMLPEERREMLRGLCRAVTAYQQTSDLDLLAKYAHDVGVTLRMRAMPDYTDALRRGQQLPPPPEGRTDLDEVLKQLRG
jgi:hypothetical protein